MGLLILFCMFVCFCAITYYYPYAGFALASLIFMLIFGGGLVLGSLFGSFGRGLAPATIGHETFYTAIYLALIIAALPYVFAHFVAFYPQFRSLVIGIVAVLTLVLSWGGLSYGYQWEVGDVLSKSCPTCTQFRSSFDTTVNGFQYAYKSDAPLNQCIVWGDARATAQCLYFSENCYTPVTSLDSTPPLECSYPSVGGSIGLLSVALAILSMGLTFWYTSEVKENSIVIVAETANNESS